MPSCPAHVSGSSERGGGAVGGQTICHLDDHVGRKARPRRRPPDGLGRRRLVEAIGLALVGREERVQPAHALLVVDPVDAVDGLGAGFELVGEPSFDHEDGHGSTVGRASWHRAREPEQPAGGPYYPNVDGEQLRADVRAIQWFHQMTLAPGITTLGVYEPARRLQRIGLPERLDGLTVLDVGAWDGFYSFEAERRGAARVLATDWFSWGGDGWGTKAGFELARRALASRVEDADI